MEYNKLIETLRDNGEADAGKYGINAYDFKHAIESDLHCQIYIKNENYIKTNHPHKIWWHLINSLEWNIMILIINAMAIAWISANIAIFPPHWGMCLDEILIAFTMWYTTIVLSSSRLSELERQIAKHTATQKTFTDQLWLQIIVTNLLIPIMWSTILIYRLPSQFQLTCTLINCTLVLLISIITFYKPFQKLYTTYISTKD